MEDQKHEGNEDSDAALVAELADSRNDPQLESIDANGESNEGATKRRKLKQKGKSSGETSDARRESHKIIEQKRRQKINDKINELRELLNYPDGSQNKAVVLQAAVDNIKNLKVVCNKLLSSHRQLQEDYLHILAENERLRKSSDQFQTIDPIEPKRIKTAPIHNQIYSPVDLRLPDMSYLYDEIPTIPPRNLQQRSSMNFNREDFHPGLVTTIPSNPEQVVTGEMDPTTKQTFGRMLFNNTQDTQ